VHQRDVHDSRLFLWHDLGRLERHRVRLPVRDEKALPNQDLLIFVFRYPELRPAQGLRFAAEGRRLQGRPNRLALQPDVDERCACVPT